ncbi:MAG TPA: hypothetical protein VKB75_03380 [Jatrophihabitans sp.]|nr:hypothetical protein [Jatrophihabitans sp.]
MNRTGRRLLGVIGSLVMVATAAGWSSSAAAAPSPVRLSISITDGVARIHHKATYAATITNQGSAGENGTLLVTVPEYLRYTRVSGNGKITRTGVRWKVTVAAGTQLTERVTVRVTAIPKFAVRVTTLASFYLGRVSGTPVIRTADADRIAGVKDAALSPAPRSQASAEPAVHPTRHESRANLWLLVGLPVFALLVLAGLLWWRVRGRKMPNGHSGTDAPNSSELHVRAHQ